MYFAQHLVGVGGEIEAVMSDHGVYAVALQRQFIGGGQQVYALPDPVGRVDAMVDRAVLVQGVPAGTADLEQVITERGIEDFTYRLPRRLQQVLAGFARVPGFQFRQNVDTLTNRFFPPGRGCLPDVGACRCGLLIRADMLLHCPASLKGRFLINAYKCRKK